MKKKTRHLTVRLLKEGVTYKTALKDDPNRKEFDLSKSLPFKGKVYVPASIIHPVSWREFLQNCVADKIGTLVSQSASALLFVECQNRLLVFTFGQGRHALKDDASANDFGLRVTLNSVNADAMRSVDARTIDERTLVIRRQSSRSSAIEAFGLDIARDLVSAATGIPDDPTFAKRVTGAEALSFSAEVEVEDLEAKCEHLLNEYAKTKYKERFGWIDKLKPVKDKATIDELNQKLLNDLNSRKVENVYLAPPGILDWDKIHGFYFFANHRTRKDDKQSDLRIEDYWSFYDQKTQLTIDVLERRDRVYVIEGDDERETDYSVYRCIVYEASYQNSTFLLSEGSWFQIDQDFVKEVDAQLLRVKEAGLNLPDAKPGEWERHYNARVVEERTGIVLMDRRDVVVAGRGRIEFCDLFTKKRQLVHVKPRKNSSSTLSHLFAQGRVSAITFLEDVGFRKKVRKIIGDESATMAKLIPEHRPNASSFEVVYAIISGIKEKKWQLRLPFFSRLNLVETIKDLRRAGFSVKIQRIYRQ